jgi:hypothetical protein
MTKTCLMFSCSNYVADTTNVFIIYIVFFEMHFISTILLKKKPKLKKLNNLHEAVSFICQEKLQDIMKKSLT